MDMLPYALIAFILALTGVAFGLMGYLSGKSRDTTVRWAIRPVFFVALLSIAGGIALATIKGPSELTVPFVALTWMLGVGLGRLSTDRG